ncbi:MAG: DUF3145 family protein [Candidatus Nanopelagicales bacterium]|jgi:hypothetical protein
MSSHHGVNAVRGVLFCHAVPRPIVPHAVWAVRDILGPDTRLDFAPAPVARGCERAVLSWSNRPGTAARLVSALRVMPGIVFEVTEEPAVDREGERYSYTPTLGLHRATIGVHGDVFVHEDRLRSAVAAAAEHGVDLAEGISHLLGQPWDIELEPYRVATSDTPVRVLHHVG